MSSIAHRGGILRYGNFGLLSKLNLLDNMTCTPLICLTAFLAKADSSIFGALAENGGTKAMGYSIHLQGVDGSELSIGKWKNAVGNHPLVRLSHETVHGITNPSTGMQMEADAADGDADIWLEDNQSWVFGIRWQNGSAVVKASRDFDDPKCFLRCLLRELVLDLDAEIRGDEGELYS